MEDEKILIRNASQVVTCSGFEAKKGKAMSDVGVIEDGAVAVSNGIITHVGPTEEVLRQVNVEDYLEVNANGRALLPGFVDISTEYIISIEQIQMLIEDRKMLLTPQILATERPDRAARALSEGRCVLIMNGSPRALIMPSNAFELTHTAADEYLNVPFSLMSRLIRIIGMFLSLLLPALYLAITLYNNEIIPTYLLYSISAARENVPFPSVVELLLMNISFELIREAGIRMRSPIGSSLGIVGGLILGQAAVSAKIVSPLMIIVIAITGIGSFATADYTLGWTYRVLRLIFIGLAAVLGLYGIAIGIVLYSLYLGSVTTFGMPFLAPDMSFNDNNMSSTIKTAKIWSMERRPHFLKTKNDKNEDNISRRWLSKNKYRG